MFIRDSLSMKIVNYLPEDHWTRFVNENAEGNIFHTPDFYHVFEKTKNCCPSLWAATDDNRILALFLPVRISLLGGPLRRFSTRAVSFGGVLCDPKNDGLEALDLVLSTYAAQIDKGVLFTEIREFNK